MKPVWVYVLVMAGGLHQPLGLTVGATERECFRNGIEIIKQRNITEALAMCFPNDQVDERFPNLSWL